MRLPKYWNFSANCIDEKRIINIRENVTAVWRHFERRKPHPSPITQSRVRGTARFQLHCRFRSSGWRHNKVPRTRSAGFHMTRSCLLLSRSPGRLRFVDTAVCRPERGSSSLPAKVGAPQHCGSATYSDSSHGTVPKPKSYIKRSDCSSSSGRLRQLDHHQPWGSAIVIHLLPPSRNCICLRARGHSYPLPEYSTNFRKKSFVTRCSLYFCKTVN